MESLLTVFVRISAMLDNKHLHNLKAKVPSFLTMVENQIIIQQNTAILVHKIGNFH